MPFHHLKIADSVELLQKHYLCCDIRSASYLERIAEPKAITHAIENGWLSNIIVNDVSNYHLTPKGKAFLESISK